jgi:hypothetical protein
MIKFKNVYDLMRKLGCTEKHVKEVKKMVRISTARDKKAKQKC